MNTPSTTKVVTDLISPLAQLYRHCSCKPSAIAVTAEEFDALCDFINATQSALYHAQFATSERESKAQRSRSAQACATELMRLLQPILQHDIAFQSIADAVTKGQIARDTESLYQHLVAENERRKAAGLPTFEPSYDLAEKIAKACKQVDEVPQK